MLDEQLKGNMEHGIFAMVWVSITKTLNMQTRKTFPSKKVIHKHNMPKKQRKKKVYSTVEAYRVGVG